MIGIVYVEGEGRGEFLLNPGGQVKANGQGEMFTIDRVLDLQKYQHYFSTTELYHTDLAVIFGSGNHNLKIRVLIYLEH